MKFLNFFDNFLFWVSERIGADLSRFEVLWAIILVASLVFLIWAIRGAKLGQGQILDELRLVQAKKQLKIKQSKKFVELYPIKPALLNKKYWRDNFEIFENIFSQKFIDVKIRGDRVQLFFDRLPKLVSFDESPKLKPMETWIGKNQFGDDVILDLQSTPGIYIDGKPKSGKSVAIFALLEGFLKGVEGSIDLLLVSTKPQDFYHLESDSRINLTLIDPFDGEITEQIDKILEQFKKISIIEQKFKEVVREHNIKGNIVLSQLIERGIYAPKRMFFIFDEAKDYLSKEKADDKQTAQAKEKLVKAVHTHIRRTARFLSMPIIVASQTQAESDLDISLKAFHLRLASNTNEAMSRLICGDSRLTDLSFTQGKYFLKTDSAEQIIKVPYRGDFN